MSGILFFLFNFSSFDVLAQEQPVITVGAKDSPESYILGEIIAKLIVQTKEARAKKSFGLGESIPIFSALTNGDIDIYPEYMGNIRQDILKDQTLKDWKSISKALHKKGFIISRPWSAQSEVVIITPKNFKDDYPKTWEAIEGLENQLGSSLMSRFNAMAEIDKKPFSEIADIFLASQKWRLLEKRKSSFSERMNEQDDGFRYQRPEEPAEKFWRLTREHLFLVLTSILLGIIIGIPLGIYSIRWNKLGEIVFTFFGVIETIPSLVLLCFLIPFLGFGMGPTLAALFMYSLFPIVRGAYKGFKLIDENIFVDQKFSWSDFPLACTHIMPGINSAAVNSVGMATLAALIGAGGYGTLILTGLALNDIPIILRGALPAAIMAFLFHWFFEFVEYLIVPKPAK